MTNDDLNKYLSEIHSEHINKLNSSMKRNVDLFIKFKSMSDLLMEVCEHISEQYGDARFTIQTEQKRVEIINGK